MFLAFPFLFVITHSAQRVTDIQSMNKGVDSTLQGVDVGRQQKS